MRMAREKHKAKLGSCSTRSMRGNYEQRQDMTLLHHLITGELRVGYR